MADYVFRITRLWNLWVIGFVNGFEFEAKVYDLGSIYGIDEGRVSKLAIYRDKPRGAVVDYDRGWVTYHQPEHEDLLDAVLNYCANLPQYTNRRLQNGVIYDVSEGGT